MKSKRLLALLVIVVTIFFLANFVSDMFLKIAEKEKVLARQKWLNASHLLFPIDYSASYRYAFSLLEQGYKTGETGHIRESIRWFKKSIGQNPFYHLSHHHLAKAYLLFNYPRGEFFDPGIREFKKAVEIYRNHKNMVKDTSEVLLSMWPLLSQKDQQLCRSLCMGLIPKLTWEEFKPLVELWWLYCKDEVFLGKLLQKKPDFFSDVARTFITLKAPLHLRWEYLANHETNVLKEVIRQYRAGNFEDTQLNFEFSLLQQLRQYRAYHLLGKNKKFDEEKYHKQKNILLYSRIQMLLNMYPIKKDPRLNDEIRLLILEYMEEKPGIKELTDLADFLEEKGFFKLNDFKSLYLKYLLEFQQSNFNDMIDEIENLKNSITFMKKEHIPDYVDILLLLSDAYETSKLLTVADQTLREILKLDPENAAAWFRMVSIQQVLGDDEVENGFQLQDKIEYLKSSRFVIVESFQQYNDVYLIEVKSIEISIAPAFKDRLNTKKIVQVFVDNKIRYEEYVDQMPEVISLELKEGSEMQKVQVQVKFL